MIDLWVKSWTTEKYGKTISPTAPTLLFSLFISSPDTIEGIPQIY